MIMNIFYILGILGLTLIIIGIWVKNKNRKIRDILYILGGFSLTSYSIYIRDNIFIILEIIFTLVAFGLISMPGTK